MPRRLTSLSFAVALLIFASISSAIDRLVPSEYPTIQAAIDAAVDGDTIIIAPGTYTGDGNRDIDFKGKAITVRSIDPNDPNIVPATAIGCERQGRGFYLNGCAGATIAGLTITNGLAEAGGGIYIEDSNVRIRKCRIIGNATKNGQDGWWEDNPSLPPGQDATDGGSGGALYCESCSVTIVDCNISGNMTGAGGAWLTDYYRGAAGNGGNGGAVFSTMCSLSMDDCIISGNTTGTGGSGSNRGGAGGDGGDGGAVFSTMCSLSIVDSIITGNATGAGGSSQSVWGGDPGSGGRGGAVYLAGSTVAISQCSLSGNRTGDGGKGDYLTGGGGKGGCGAGIYCDQSCSLEIHGSDVRDNIAGTGGAPGGPGGDGAGIYCTSTVPLFVRDCNITGNQTGQPGLGDYPAASGCGGGIYCRSATITSCIITNNSSGNAVDSGYPSGPEGGCGGGIYSLEYLELVDCNVSGNRTGAGGCGEWGGGKGGDGGGVWGETVIATGCTFVGNETGDAGEGGMHSVGADSGAGGGVYCTKAEIDNCLFSNNTTGKGGESYTVAGAGGSGGGLYCTGQAILNDSVLCGNSTGSGGYREIGGGSGTGGAVHSPLVVINNCLFEHNSTGQGAIGGIAGGDGGHGAAIWTTSGRVTNCTIVHNSCGPGGTGRQRTGARGRGAAVYAREDTVITNSVAWGNEPDGLFGIDCNNLSYCDIQDANCVTGVGSFSADPLFVRPGYWADVNDPNIVVEPNDPNAVWLMGDYHLSQVAAGQASDSPCVDAGSDLALTLGMDKFTTRTDHVGDTGIVDMGYHYPMPKPADIDGDGDVDLTDFAILAGHWELAAMEIPMGSAIVDGDISEWSEGVQWVPLDKVYYGNPADVRWATYALRWNPDTNKIYVAVIVKDGGLWPSDEYIKWDASDRIEVYSQGDAEGGTGWLRVYDVAQQYMMGPNTSGGSWATWAYGEALGADVGLEYAVAVNGDQIIHEAGVLMFDNYAGFSGGTTIVTELKPGHVVGFDVLVSSRWESDGFGMLSENLMTGKSGNAAQFAKYTLVQQTSVSPHASRDADLDKNGIIDWFDLASLAENWLCHTRW